MNELSWEAIKDFYQREFGIDGWVVELYANLDILCLCASGASNRDIEEFLEIPQKEIVKVIRDAFDFDGWENSLPINPYRIFYSYEGEITSLYHFLDFTKAISTELQSYVECRDIKADKLFYICETMYDIERKIQDEWI
jgi:hypothetical protein